MRHEVYELNKELGSRYIENDDRITRVYNNYESLGEDMKELLEKLGIIILEHLGTVAIIYNDKVIAYRIYTPNEPVRAYILDRKKMAEVEELVNELVRINDILRDLREVEKIIEYAEKDGFEDLVEKAYRVMEEIASG